MPIDIEVGAVAVHRFTNMIRHPADGENIASTIKRKRVLLTQTFAGEHFVMDRAQARIVRLKGVKIRHSSDDNAREPQKHGFEKNAGYHGVFCGIPFVLFDSIFCYYHGIGKEP